MITMTQRMVATPVTAISLSAARLSIAGAVAFSVLVLALHFIRPELDPSWRFISEYAIGAFGWVMMLAFLSMAVSCAALFVAIRSQVAGIAGRIGMMLLLVVSVALIAAGTFTMDPVTATKDQLTTHGSLHGLASMVGVPGLPMAAVLISWGLARNAAWSSERKRLIATSVLSLICLVAMFGYIGVTLP